MKKLFLITIMLVSVQVFGQNFNKEKDVLVNTLIDNGDIVKIESDNSGDYNTVQIYYSNYLLGISHQKYVPLQRKRILVFLLNK